MDKNEYLHIKEFRTYEEQIEILKARNLIINDEEFAKQVLSRINYYRFSAYTLTFKSNNTFKIQTTFEQVLDVYEFDRKLRLEILCILEVIEVSSRAKIAYHLAEKYGPLAYLDKSNFVNEDFFNLMVRQINEQIDRSKELFVIHHKENYEGVFPIWVVIEVISFSLLSKIYSNLKSEDQVLIASCFSTNYKYLRNWLYALSTLRNTCAHFGRLYNRYLPVHLKLSKDDRKIINNNSIFSVIYVMQKITKDEELFNNFVVRVNNLIEEYDFVDLSKLGFPEDWKSVLVNNAN